MLKTVYGNKTQSVLCVRFTDVWEGPEYDQRIIQPDRILNTAAGNL